MNRLADRADLTVAEASVILRVTSQTIRGWIASGRISAHKNASGHWRLSAAEVDRARGIAEEPISTEAGA